MLVLTRKNGEAVDIGGNIKVRVIECGRHRVRLAIEAPRHVRILREEVTEQRDANKVSEKTDSSSVELIAPLTLC